MYAQQSEADNYMYFIPKNLRWISGNCRHVYINHYRYSNYCVRLFLQFYSITLKSFTVNPGPPQCSMRTGFANRVVGYYAANVRDAEIVITGIQRNSNGRYVMLDTIPTMCNFNFVVHTGSRASKRQQKCQWLHTSEQVSVFCF